MATPAWRVEGMEDPRGCYNVLMVSTGGRKGMRSGGGNRWRGWDILVYLTFRTRGGDCGR